MLGSLRSRLALSNLLITLIALAILTFVFGQLLRQHSIDAAQNDVASQANQLRYDVNGELQSVQSTPATNAAPNTLYHYLLRDSHVLGKRIIFFSRAGLCGFDSNKYSNKRRNASSENLANACFDQDYNRWLVYPVAQQRPGSKFVEVGHRQYLLTQRRTSPGAIVLVTDASQIVPPLTALAPAFLLSALTAAAIWIVMAIFFGYTVSRPLRKVSNAARAIASGDYSQTVQISGAGEIAELGSSFNHMVTQVRAANQLLKDFVANVSHDLRTPITLISGYAGSVLDGTVEEKGDVHEAVQVIAEEALRMQRLVDDLLQLTRLESGLKKFERAPVVLAQLVERTIRRAIASYPERTIANDVGSDVSLVYADEELLERALMNLLNNALQYTTAADTVAVSSRQFGQWIDLRVSDTGVGLSAEDQTRVFERFYRVDRGRSRDNGHSGLGLPIVKEIVEAHGGTVSISSIPGSGASFTLRLPVFQATDTFESASRAYSKPS